MSHAAATVDAVHRPAEPTLEVPPSAPSLAPKPRPTPPPTLMLMERSSVAGRRSATLAVSMSLHAVLVLLIVLVPLLFYDSLPSQDVLKAFFVQPLEIAPPPPPPPPPAASRAVVRAAPKVVQATAAFVAPIEVPNQVLPEESLDLGVEGGAAGGVEGGVPGGVVGGVVGGLPTSLPPPPAQVVRIGGKIAAPRIVRRVEPVYPDLAAAARIGAIVVVEAEVDVHGVVKSVKVLSGHPLFDEPAMNAVKQWRYQPLLLNGEPTGFILSVIINFNLRTS
jgi:periplasmic protein TonB